MFGGAVLALRSILAMGYDEYFPKGAFVEIERQETRIVTKKMLVQDYRARGEYECSDQSNQKQTVGQIL